MGGTIGVTIREEDGTIHKMARWTNTLPHFTQSVHFIEKDKKHLYDYLDAFYKMKTDYERNKDSGKFEFNMTDVYIPYSGYVAPIEYGLVVIDYQTSRVLHCQGHSSLNVVLSCHIELFHVQDEDTQKAVQELIDFKKIKHLKTLHKDEKTKGWQEIPVEYKMIKDKTGVERMSVVPEILFEGEDR